MGKLCPFDDLPCDFVDSCDDAMALRYGLVPPMICSRAVVGKGVGKK